MNNYICKVATVEEVSKKFDYEIERATDDKENWIVWKEKSVDRTRKGLSITYIGLLNNQIICECTAAIDLSVVDNDTDLVDSKTAYLYAFRTNSGYQGKGYFSKLFKFMIDDLKSKGFEKATIGVEPEEEKNKAIYQHYGFVNYIKDKNDVYPNGHKINVEYYSKML